MEGDDIELNNKGFILYDALVAFMILASTLVFFNQMVNILIEANINVTYQIYATNAIKKKIVDNDYDDPLFYFEMKGRKTCASYEDKKEVCI